MYKYTKTGRDFVLHPLTVTRFTQDQSKNFTRHFNLNFPYPTPEFGDCREIDSGDVTTSKYVKGHIRSSYVEVY